MTPFEMEKEILKDGWVYKCTKGSHRQYVHHAKPGKVTIPFHRKPKDLHPKTIASIRKQAGIECPHRKDFK